MQILPGQKIQPSASVLVEVRLNGSIHIRYKSDYLDYKFIEKPLPTVSRRTPDKLPKRPTRPSPSKNHPWKRFFLNAKAAVNHDRLKSQQK
jgi:hypothetical protein